MEGISRDIRYGLRSMLKKPGFTAVVVIALALGIGANTAIFSVVYAVLLRGLPYPDPDRLVMVQEDLPRLNFYYGTVSGAEFEYYRDHNEVFSKAAGFTTVALNLTGAGEPRRIRAARVSASLFPLLGIEPLRGRTFSAEEDARGRDAVAVLSQKLWRGQFGSDPDIVGRTIRLDERACTVIGVMPSRFEFPPSSSSFSESVDLWVPLALTDREKQGWADSFDFGVIGRLKPGVSLEQAAANISAVADQFQKEHPDVYAGDVQVSAGIISLEEKIVRNVRPFLLILLGAVGLVLLIACANVANLLLARAAGREKEIAIRLAIGAGSWRLIRQLLTESTLLGLLGGGVGLLLAGWVTDIIVRFGPTDIPRLGDVRVDPLVLGFTLLISVATGILFGLAPAIQSTRVNLNEVLKEGGGRSTRGREGSRMRNILVVFETASALVLLIGAALLIVSFIRVLRVPPGFDPNGVVAARTTLSLPRYPKPEQSKALHRRILERLAALPGVSDVAVTTSLPMTGEWTIGYYVEGWDPTSVGTASGALVSDGYFKTMGISLVGGRNFNDDDRVTTMPVVLINEAMARKTWPGQDAIGKRIKWGGWPGADWLAVVGIVADVKVSSLEVETTPAIYMSIFQIPRTRSNAIYLTRTDRDPAELISSVRSEIRSVDEDLPVYSIKTMTQIVSESLSQRRFSTLLLTLFSVAALLLAVIGLYGVMSYSVGQRTHEIGIRVALGARPRDVIALVVGQGMAIAGIGLAVGLAASFILMRLLEGLLFGVSATDIPTFIAITVLLGAASLVANYVPARRATAVDPINALRCE
jgi:putative ABC transport system permease protein